jgi:cell division septation protein DedD
MPSARLAAPAPAAAPPPSVTARPPASAADEGLAVGPPAAGARAAGVPPAAPLAPAAAGGQGGGWTVQANPTRSREEAEALSRRLEGRGYDAVVVRVPRDGDVWYRVRIGRYQTPEQATEAMQRLREREGVPHVFVASE